MTTGGRTLRARLTLLAVAVGILVGPVVAWAPPRAVAQTDPSTIVGEGGDAFDPVIRALLVADQSSLAPLNPAYTNVKLDPSIADFVGSTPGDFGADYAVSERPLTTTESNLARSNGRSFAYVPIAATPVAIVTLVPTSAWAAGDELTMNSSDLCQGMPLTVTELGDIFGRNASNPLLSWTDTDSDNKPLSCTASGGAVAFEPVALWANTDPTMENEALMALLDSNPTSKTLFDAGLAYASTHMQGLTSVDTPSENWPYSQNSVIGGDQTLIDKLIAIDTHTNAPINSAPQWQLGATAPIASDWTGAPLGVNWNLPTAAIQNAQGSFVAPSTASAEAAQADATLASTSDPTTDDLVTFTASATDAEAYNSYLMMEEYLVVPTNTLAADKATKLAQLIRFAVGTTGQKIIESFGVAPATPAMVSADLKVAAQLTDLGLSEAARTTTTTTPSSTTSTNPASASLTANNAATTGTGSAGTGNSGSGQGSPSLAVTGSNPLPLVGVGTLLIVVAVFGRRRLSRRAVAVTGPVPTSSRGTTVSTGEAPR